MPDIQQLAIDAVKEIIAKSVTFGATAFLSLNGIPTLYQYFIGGSPDTIAVQLLIVGTAYAIWTKAIVPVIEAFFQAAQGTSTKAKASPTKSRFELL